jgi:hypothetical protein
MLWVQAAWPSQLSLTSGSTEHRGHGGPSLQCFLRAAQWMHTWVTTSICPLGVTTAVWHTKHPTAPSKEVPCPSQLL